MVQLSRLLELLCEKVGAKVTDGTLKTMQFCIPATAIQVTTAFSNAVSIGAAMLILAEQEGLDVSVGISAGVVDAI